MHSEAKLVYGLNNILYQKLSIKDVQDYMARLAGKYHWREFPVLIMINTSLGNTFNFAKVGNTGIYGILMLF